MPIDKIKNEKEIQKNKKIKVGLKKPKSNHIIVKKIKIKDCLSDDEVIRSVKKFFRKKAKLHMMEISNDIVMIYHKNKINCSDGYSYCAIDKEGNIYFLKKAVFVHRDIIYRYELDDFDFEYCSVSENEISELEKDIF